MIELPYFQKYNGFLMVHNSLVCVFSALLGKQSCFGSVTNLQLLQDIGDVMLYSLLR